MLLRLSVLLLGCLSAAYARIDTIEISSDPRRVFSIESFGAAAGAQAEITLESFTLLPTFSSEEQYSIAFWAHLTTSEAGVTQMIEEVETSSGCVLDTVPTQYPDDQLFYIGNPKSWKMPTKKVFTFPKPGLYDIAFVRCTPRGGTHSFKARVNAYNIDDDGDKNYLSVGEKPLPFVYLAMGIVFSILTAVWIVQLRRRRDNVHKIHHLMTAVMVVKSLSLIAESIPYFAIASTGAAEGWNVLLYIITFIKGVLLFAVLLLIGTGWSMLKPTLNSREKKVFLVVIPLQILDNIAFIVMNEEGRGTKALLNWTNVLHLVDIVCCCAILFPIVWQIRHLRSAASQDEKAADVLERLTQFRQFYIMVVVYIYVTRFLVVILAAELPYNVTWIGPFTFEITTLIFLVFTGWKFRPAADNAYLRLRMDSGSDMEFGLPDEEAGEAPRAPRKDSHDEQIM